MADSQESPTRQSRFAGRFSRGAVKREWGKNLSSIDVANIGRKGWRSK
jgi:hypothetical protein